MFWRYGVPLIIAGVFALLLCAWALAYWRSRRAVTEDQEFEKSVMDHEKEMTREYEEQARREEERERRARRGNDGKDASD